MRFNNLHIEGYRSLVNISLPLRALMVMIGPNGSGKTTLLDVFRFLEEATHEKLSEALKKRGGLDRLLTRISPSPEKLKIKLDVDAQSDRSREPICYRLELAPRNIDYMIPLERLEWKLDPDESRPFLYIDAHYHKVKYTDPDPKISGLVEPTWEYDYAELALAQVPKMFEEPETLRKSLSATKFFSFLDVGERSVVRLPQSLTPTTRPGPNGENLYSALYNLRASHRAIYTQIEEMLELGFPGFDRLEFPVVGAGQVTMTWYQNSLRDALYPSEISEGMLRFLWLTTILLSPNVSPIILIDEPEVSLHPELLKLLAGLLQDAAERQQVMVATHSPDLVRWLQPDEVLVLDKEEGQTQFTWADNLDLAEWLKEYTLRELWLMGTLGGRP